MTVVDLQWIVGTAIAFVLSIAGIAIAAFRAVSSKMDAGFSEMRKIVKDGDDQLHSRISRLRQDTTDNYVLRRDLDSHMLRLDASVKEIRDDQKTVMRSLAALEARSERLAD